MARPNYGVNEIRAQYIKKYSYKEIRDWHLNTSQLSTNLWKREVKRGLSSETAMLHESIIIEYNVTCYRKTQLLHDQFQYYNLLAPPLGTYLVISHSGYELVPS